MTDDRGRYADVAAGAHEGFNSSWDSTSEPSDKSPSASTDESPRPPTWNGAGHQGYFIDGAEAFATIAVDRWHDIASARPGQRVVVGRSCLKPDGVGSYWWEGEDVIGADGRPAEHPTATHWRRRSA